MPREPKPIYVKSLEARMSAVELKQERTDEVIDLLLAWKTSVDESNRIQAEMLQMGERVLHAFEGLVWLGNAVKWAAGIVIAVGGAVIAIKGYFK